MTGLQTQDVTGADQVQDFYQLTPELLDAILESISEEDLPRLEALIVPLHAADKADLLEQITPASRQLVVDLLLPDLEPQILAHLGETTREDLREHVGTHRFASLIGALATDDAVDIVEDLDEAVRETVLAAVPETERVAVEENLQFPDDSAGRLMRREVVALPTFWNVGQAIDHFRTSTELPEEFYAVFIVDPSHKPVGLVELSTLLRNETNVPLQSLIDGELPTVDVDTDQEQVSYVFQQYGLTEVAVVDNSGRLSGAITFDDMVDVISEESEEDVLRLGGVSETDLHASVLETIRKRFLWLFINLCTAILASVVIGLFEATIEQMVALAVLMPIVASMGGNAGTQTMTVAVRALATRDLTRANTMRVVFKELLVGSINGILFAVFTGLVAWAWFQDLALGFVIALAMIANLVVAGLFGAVIPIVLERIKVDPAVAAGVFLTTVTDVVGFLVFLALGAAFLL